MKKKQFKMCLIVINSTVIYLQKGLKPARTQDVIKTLPRVKQIFRKQPLPAIKNIEDSYEEEPQYLERQGNKFIIPSNIIDIYTRLEVLLGSKLSGQTDTLTEASNLIEQLYQRGEIKIEQQNRNALDKFRTQLMNLPCETLEQIAFNTRPKIEEQKLIVMNESYHEQHLSQPLQTNNEQI